MSQSLTERQTDRWTAALGLMTSTAYVLHAQTIEDSLLADGVGVAGVPIGVGCVMAVTSLALLLKSLRVAGGDSPSSDAESDSRHTKAAGLLAILAVYVGLLPVLGYVVSIGLLIGAVAWFAGARQWQTIFYCMLLAGPFMWFIFDWTLEIRLPVGLWPQWVGR
jgi:putative tricarboxylic transport membrane protein